MTEVRTRDGYLIRYEESGTGAPLVFLHGWAISGRAWTYQRDWFARTHRVIIPNLRGLGGSVPPPTGPTVDDCAADLVDLLTVLELRDATLVAWSMGGTIALRAAAELRDRLSALVLVGVTPRFTAGNGFPFGLHPDEARGMALRLKRSYGGTLEEFFRGMFAAGEVTDEGYRQIVADIVKGAEIPDRGVVLRSLESLAHTDVRDQLPGITLPTLLIHGQADRICLPDASRFMAKVIPSADLEILPGIGHAPFLSHPAQFNTLVQRFLDETRAQH